MEAIQPVKPTLHDQIDWEIECADRGSRIYKAEQDKLRSKTKGDQTNVAHHLIYKKVEEVAVGISKLSDIHVGKGGKYNKLLKTITVDNDFDKIAYIALKSMFGSVLTSTDPKLTSVCMDISTKLEADLKCSKFDALYPAYYRTLLKSFEDDNVTAYHHRHNVLINKFNHFNIDWIDWTPDFKLRIGSKVLDIIMQSMEGCFDTYKHWARGKSTFKLGTTPLFDGWIEAFESERGMLNPTMLPLKIPPKAWEVGQPLGGYYTPRMCNNLDFVKTKNKVHKRWVEEHDLVKHKQAVNRMQRTAWCINERVLKVQEHIYKNDMRIGIPSSQPLQHRPYPEHLKEVEKSTFTPAQREEVLLWKSEVKQTHRLEMKRKGKVLAFLQAHSLAKELRNWEELFFAWSCDFRGRVYCATAGLSPQGADTARGLLLFKKRVMLGREGATALAIQGANVYGIDKISFEERVRWVHDNKDLITAIAEDPISHTDLWGSADKPYQFLAFCYEWVDSAYGTDFSFMSNLVVARDGSCNGLQHYSALLRDSVGAVATNLTINNKPEDIYQEVADECTRLLKLSDDPKAYAWLQAGVSRACAKKPVMTLPYGATQQSSKAYILEYVREYWHLFNVEDEDEQFVYATFLVPFLWEAIETIVVAARTAMRWLRQYAGDSYLQWITPVGFPVYQYYRKTPSKLITTQLLGGISLTITNGDFAGVPKVSSQRNSIAPNFIHSVDSTHMVMTILEVDLPAYAMIHDDYGTHAGNVHLLNKATRKAFYNLYTQHDPLADWAKQLGVHEMFLPPKGDYDIKDILKADYFFA